MSLRKFGFSGFFGFLLSVGVAVPIYSPRERMAEVQYRVMGKVGAQKIRKRRSGCVK
jgi:hypothetical protein